MIRHLAAGMSFRMSTSHSDGLGGDALDAVGLLCGEAGLETHRGATEALAADNDDIVI